MITTLVGIFMILHGLVYLLYLGQSARFFELQPGLAWPDGSWAFARLFGDGTTRLLASIACGLAALGFVLSGVGILANQGWWRLALVISAAFASVFIVLFWDGKMQTLDGKGGIGLLINLAILTALFILR